jgi:hypothetical protein
MVNFMTRSASLSLGLIVAAMSANVRNYGQNYV